MKRVLLLILMLNLAASPLAIQLSEVDSSSYYKPTLLDTIFQKASDLYWAKEYREAILMYRSLRNLESCDTLCIYMSYWHCARTYMRRMALDESKVCLDSTSMVAPFDKMGYQCWPEAKLMTKCRLPLETNRLHRQMHAYLGIDRLRQCEQIIDSAFVSKEIKFYERFVPTTKALQEAGLAPGDTVLLDCWIHETIVIPSN